MGNFSYNPPTDFIKQIERMGNSDKISEKMLNESIPIVERKLIKELTFHENTGDLQASIKSTKAKKTKRDGYFVSARPTGESDTYVNNKGETKMRKPIRNMEKLVYHEYGTSSKAASPVISRVLNDTEDAVLNKMQEVFNREIGE